MHFLWPNMAVLFHGFPKGSSVSWQSFQCRHYLPLPIYYCRMAGWTASWKVNKCFLAVLCSALLVICFPYPVALSPVPSTFFSLPSVAFLFHVFLSPAILLPFQSNLNPKPTHPLVSLPLVIKTATLSLLSTIKKGLRKCSVLPILFLFNAKS